MAAFGSFADDSGSHTQGRVMVLGSVVAEHKKWRGFAGDWWAALTKIGKPLNVFKGDIYFKSFEAETQTGCFDGFSRSEANTKVELLTEVLLDYLLYGMLSAIQWKHFVSVFQARVPRSTKGRLSYHFQHPYYLCFQDLVSAVITEHVYRNLGEIDFMFDKQGKMSGRAIRDYEKNGQPNFPAQAQQIAGRITEGDDKIDLPIQGADLLAWQARNRSVLGTRATSSAKKLIGSQRVRFHVIDKNDLQRVADWFNYSPATRVMLQRFSNIPMRVLRRF